MRRLPALTLALAVALVATNVRAQQSKPEARPLLVGVVDMARVFHSYKRRDDLEKQFNKLKERLEGELQATTAEIEALRKSMDFRPTPEWREQRAALKRLIQKQDGERVVADEELRLEIWQLTLMLRGEIEAAVRDHGQRHGYDLILKTHASAGSGEEGFTEERALVDTAPVLYAGPRVEITDEVLAELNAPRMRITPAKKPQEFR